MRKALFYLSILVLLVIPAFASAQTNWLINNFHSDIDLQTNGKVLITENLSVDFTTQKHGIYRDIPYIYYNDDGSKLYTQLDIKSVSRDGQTEPYQTTINNANRRVKIGDADKLISGPHSYTIIYEATGVILASADYHELYWNITGHEWEVPIKQASATVTLPRGEFKQSACYEGNPGSQKNCARQKAGTQTINFASTSPLAPGQEMTVAAGFDKDLIPLITVAAPPSAADIIAQPITIVSFVIVLASGLFIVFRRWWLRGRDPSGRQTISPEYDSPGNLRPAEIGVLIDERADTLDVSATIVDLAVRGYLTIHELPKKKWLPLSSPDYELARTDQSLSDLLPYEEKLFSLLFANRSSVKLSSLQKTFYRDLAQVKEELYQTITDKKLFAGNPEQVRKKNIGLSFIILFIGILLTGYGLISLTGFPLGAGAASILVGLVTLIIAFFMPRRTPAGQELHRQALGYKLFVSGTEKYRQPFFERQNIFMEILPYAIVFGVTDKLAKAFKEMGIEPPFPSWYTGPHAFNAAIFISNIDNFSSSLSSAMSVAPSSGGSGGGGLSGGGFGGGGGGSW